DPDDQYLLAAYADFLLDRDHAAEVANLLAGRDRAEHLLLRLVLAEQRIGSPRLDDDKRAVGEAFASARRAGHAVHEGDEARFALHVLADPRRALALALGNWRSQRESRDARAVLEAALACNDAAAAAPVLAWMRSA